MKKIYALALAVLPLFSFGQISIEWITEQDQTGYQGDDVGFDYYIHNLDTSNPVNITWELLHDRFATTGVWTDYMCEGIFVCWPDSVRTNTFTLEAGQSIEMYQHIQTFEEGDSGTWVSNAKIYIQGDSANSLITTTATLKTGLEVEVDGKTIYIMDGDSFEYYGDDLVPLYVNSLNLDQPSGLSQNMPNPFKGETVIPYQLESGAGFLKFHDLTGQLVMELPLNRSEGQVNLRGELEAGIYFYSLWENGKMIDSKRMQVIK